MEASGTRQIDVATSARRAIVRMLREYDEPLSGARVLAMCSGGADSVALVDLLATLSRGNRPAGVCVLFLDHGLRDIEEDRAAAAAVAALHSFEFVERRTDEFGTPASAESAAVTGDLQARARGWRYAVAAELAAAGDFTHVATGHHADDQLETLLYGLAASSGLHALSGIPFQRTLADGVALVRPLLALHRDAVESYLVARGLAWAIDPSNATGDYARNRMRRDVVPALRDAHPGAPANLERTRRQVAEAAQVTDELAAALLRDQPRDSFDVRLLDTLSAPARATLIAAWLRRAGLGRAVGARVVGSLVRLATAESTAEPAGSVDIDGACIDRDRYYLLLRRLSPTPGTKGQDPHGE